MKEARKKREREISMRQQQKEAQEMATYNPWGRGGGGAPLRDAAGDVIASFRHVNEDGRVEAYRVESEQQYGSQTGMMPQGAMPSQIAHAGAGRPRPIPLDTRLDTLGAPADNINNNNNSGGDETQAHSRFRFALASPERQSDILRR